MCDVECRCRMSSKYNKTHYEHEEVVFVLFCFDLLLCVDDWIGFG